MLCIKQVCFLREEPYMQYAVVEVCGVMRHFVEKLPKRGCLPHKTASWIFDGIHDTMKVAQSAEVSCYVIEPVGSGNFGSM